MTSRPVDLAALVTAASLAAALVVVTPSAASAERLALTLDPARTTIHWRLRGFPDTVRGVFALQGGDLRFDPATGAADGCVRVDARSGASGNVSRDRKMHDEILESARYPVITLVPQRLVRSSPPAAADELRLSGILALRGAEHPVTLALRLATASGVLTADTSIAIPYVAWGLRDPSVLIFRASKTVELDIHAIGSLTPVTSSTVPPGCGP